MTLSQALSVLSAQALTSHERCVLNHATHTLNNTGRVSMAHLSELLTMTERLMFDTNGQQPAILDMTYLFAEQKGTLINA